MAKRSRLKYFNDFHIIFLDMRPNSHTRLSTHWILYGPILEKQQRRSVINISVFFKLLAFPKHDLDVMWHKKRRRYTCTCNSTVTWTGDFIDNTDEDGHIFLKLGFVPGFLASMLKSWYETQQLWFFKADLYRYSMYVQ